MGIIYKRFRHGLAHNLFPIRGASNSAIRSVCLATGEQISLSWYKKNLEGVRDQCMKIDLSKGKPLVIVPQVLFLDTVTVMDSLKKRIDSEESMQNIIVKNDAKIREKTLRHDDLSWN